MIFAVIGDVCGHASAFQAVLNSIEDEGIHVVFQTGNLSLGGDGGAKVLRQIRDKTITAVQGKDDAALVRFGRKQSGRRGPSRSAAPPALAAAHQSLESADIEWLRSLPKKRIIEMDGFSILLCHGAPSNQSHQLSPQTPLPRFRREREACHGSVIVCGGSETAFSTPVDDALFVMPGPLIREKGVYQWCLVDLEREPWSVRFHSVQCNEDGCVIPEDDHAGI